MAIRFKRAKLGIPNPDAREGAHGSPDWSAAEDQLVRSLPPKEAAQRTGRTMDAVYSRRHHLGVSGRGRRRAQWAYG